MKTKRNTKKKMHKTSDPHYKVQTYGQGKNPFNVEWVKYYNSVEGRDQIIFLYKNKENDDIVKYSILR